MILTSKDLLFIVLALCASAVTIFLCWTLYYCITTVKHAHDIVRGAKKRVDYILAFIDKTKEKAGNTATTVTAVSKAVIETLDYIKTKKAAKKNKKSA